MLEQFGVYVNGIPLIFVVLGLITFLGKMGLKGRGKLVGSMVTGVVLGCAYQVASAGVPADFAAGFAMVVYGLALGLVASGIYDTGKELAEKAQFS